MYSNLKSITALFTCALSAGLFVQNIDAAQSSTNFDVQAEVLATCKIESIVSDIDFGILIPGSATEYDARGRFSYACTTGIRGRFSLDGGTTMNNVLDRAMQGADGSMLKYQLYTNTNYRRIWGDGTGASRTVRSGLGRGMDRPRNRNIFARVLDTDLQNVNTGAYSDTVTINFDF